MKVPVSWLRDYVELTLPVEELARRLVFTSCEVDRIVRRGVSDVDGNYGHFVVGKVLEAEKHPNADKLQLTKVDVGDGEPRSIVCGAWNFGAGATVAVVTPGAVDARRLPDREAEAARRGLRRDDPVGARARARHRPRRDHGARRRARGRDAARRRAAARRRRARDRDALQPARPDVDLRDRARGGRADRCGARTGTRYRPGARRRRAVLARDRRPRGMPALHRARLPRRHDRRVARVAEGTADGRRDAADLERRRHHQLRDARARQPAARLRRRHAARRHRRAARAAGRGARHARRHEPRARSGRSRDRRPRAPDRPRRRDGRREHRGLARPRRRSCSRPRTSSR